ncbi:MAG: ABC transporter substrate-binding protein, partial [Thermodesulfobacteriota bacterium]
DDPKLDALIDQYRESLDEAERIRLSREIQNNIHEVCAYVPTFMVPYVRIAYWRWLKLPDFHGTRMSDNLFDPFSSTVGGLFWLDPAIYDDTVSKMKQGTALPPVTITDTRFKVTGDPP